MKNNFEVVHQVFSVLDSSSMTSEQMLEKLPMILLAVDADGNVFKANRMAQDFYQCTQRQLLGKPFLNLISANDRAQFANYFAKSKSDPELASNAHCLVERHDGCFIAWNINQIKSLQSSLKDFYIFLGSDATELISVQMSIEAAKIIQKALLPAGSQNGSVEISSYYDAAGTTGGDLFDYYFDQERNRFYVLIADVNGHGMPAALMTGTISGAFKGIIARMRCDKDCSDDGKCLQRLAQCINESYFAVAIRTNLLATMTLICIDFDGEKVTYINAGHQPIFKIGQDNSVTTILAPGSPLGHEPHPEFGFKEFAFTKGDSLFLYTDGLIENKGTDGTSLTPRMLKQALARHRALDAKKKRGPSGGTKDLEQ